MHAQSNGARKSGRIILILTALAAAGGAHAQSIYPGLDGPDAAGKEELQTHASDEWTFDMLAARMREGHPLVEARAAEFDAAKAELGAARWQYAPTPSVSVNYTGTGGDGRIDETVTVASLTQPIWSGGRIGSAIKGAKARRGQARLSIDEARDALGLALTDAYGQWLTAAKRIEALNTEVAALKALENMIRRRASSGVNAASDIELVRSRINQSLSEIDGAEAMKEAAANQLSQLAGAPVTRVSPDWPARDFAGDADMLAAAVLNHAPSLRRLDYKHAEAKARAGAARAAMLPTVFARVEQRYGVEYIGGAESDTRVLIGVESSLGAGLGSLRAVSAEKARAGAVLAEKDAVRRDLAARAMVELARYRAARRRAALLGETLQSARNVETSYRNQFLVGRRNWVDLVNAVREVRQISVALADAHVEESVASYRLSIMANGL